jgi:hypothetical protein
VELRYLYVGSSDTGADVAAWLRLPGISLAWRFRHFGADVAAVDTGGSPTVLVADHRPPGSVLPIYTSGDLTATTATLEAAGWTRHLGPVGTPEGPATVLRSPGGTEIAVLQVDRPQAMERAWTDEGNTRRVRG